MTKQSGNGLSQGPNSAVEPGVHFTEADFQVIAEELAVDATPGLKNQLISAAKNYLSSKHYWENREDTAELRADLTKIDKQAKKLIESLESLSPLGHLVFKQELPDFERTIGEIRKLQEAAENEVQHLKFVKRGPTKNVPLIMHIVMLAAVWYEHTGRTPGYTTHPIKEVRGGPFPRFVIANLRAVAPDLVESEQDEQRIVELIKNNIDIIRSHPKFPQSKAPSLE